MRVKLGDPLYFMARTKDSSRTPTAPTGNVAYAAYRGDSDTGMTNSSGNMTAVAGVTGGYRGSITCSEANGYASGNSYTILVTYTVGGTVRGEEIEFFVD